MDFVSDAGGRYTLATDRALPNEFLELDTSKKLLPRVDLNGFVSDVVGYKNPTSHLCARRGPG